MMNKYNKINKRYKKNIFFIVISIFLLNIILLLLIKYGFHKIILIPTSYMILFIIFPMNRKYLFNISILLINLSMFIRYVLLTLVYFTNVNGFDKLSSLSIYLMIFEMICIFITIELFCRTRKFSEFQKQKKTCLLVNFQEIYINKTYGVSIIFIISLGTFLIIYNPIFRNQIFRGILNRDYNFNGDASGALWILYNLFLIIGVLLFLQKIKKANFYNESIMKLVISISIIIVYMLIISIGGTGHVSRWPILFNGIIFINLLTIWYKKYNKFILITFSICLIVGLFFLTIKKFLGTSTIDVNTIKLGLEKTFNYDMFNDYFGGLKSIDYAILTNKIFGGKIGIRTLINDILGNFPVINRIINIGDNRTVEFYNHVVYNSYISVDKIVPMIGQGYIYFGILFAPIFSILTTILALLFSMKYKKTQNLLLFYSYLYLTITLSFFMFQNINIIFQTLWIKIIPVILVEKSNIKFGGK